MARQAPPVRVERSTRRDGGSVVRVDTAAGVHGRRACECGSRARGASRVSGHRRHAGALHLRARQGVARDRRSRRSAPIERGCAMRCGQLGYRTVLCDDAYAGERVPPRLRRARRATSRRSRALRARRWRSKHNGQSRGSCTSCIRAAAAPRSTCNRSCGRRASNSVTTSSGSPPTAGSSRTRSASMARLASGRATARATIACRS